MCTILYTNRTKNTVSFLSKPFLEGYTRIALQRKIHSFMFMMFHRVENQIKNILKLCDKA